MDRDLRRPHSPAREPDQRHQARHHPRRARLVVPGLSAADDLHGAIACNCNVLFENNGPYDPAVGTDNYGGLCKVYVAEEGRRGHLHERRRLEGVPAARLRNSPPTSSTTASQCGRRGEVNDPLFDGHRPGQLHRLPFLRGCLQAGEQHRAGHVLQQGAHDRPPPAPIPIWRCTTCPWRASTATTPSACACARRAPATSARTAWCWWTTASASAASCASWRAPTACARTTPARTRASSRSAPCARIASTRATFPRACSIARVRRVISAMWTILKARSRSCLRRRPTISSSMWATRPGVTYVMDKCEWKEGA